MKRNWIRRSFGTAVCGIAPALAVLSLWAGLGSNQSCFAGSLWLIPAGLIAGLNFHLQFIRPYLHFRRHRSMDDYHFVSGIPVLATIITVCVTAMCFGAVATAVFAMVILLVDTSGPIWFLIWTWRDESLWDVPGR